nr:putative reverse transcriptase domain-containing protein [Tanacetum cinerariifolium]
MSSDNAQSAVTYTSISSDSNRPSWGILLMNAGELSEMDPYEEIAQQGQVPPLSPAYMPNPMELDEHVPVYVLEPEHPEYHAPSNDDIQVEDKPHADDASLTTESPGYIVDSDSMGKDDDEDPEEDPSEKHEPEDDDDPEEDPNEEPEPEDEDTKEEELFEGSDETKPFEEDETAVTPPPPRHRKARISVRPQIPMAASTQVLIDAYDAGSPLFPLPPTSPAYDQEPLGHRAVMILMRDDIPKEDMPPQRRFVLTTSPPGCDVAESSATTAARASREDVGYVRALHAYEHRMMTSIEEVNLRISYQAQVHRKESKLYHIEMSIRFPPPMRYETKLQERQSAEDLAVTQMMRIHSLEARSQIDTVEDTDSSCVVGLSQWLEKMESVFHISGCAGDNQVDKYISGLPDNIHGNVMSARPKTLNDAIELASDLMDQKLCTYAKRQNDNKRKADDSSRNNHQQQPHKKQNVARPYTAGLGEKKAYTGNLPLCTKWNYHHTRPCAPKCNNYFLNPPFNIDLKPVPLGSFDVIIGMNWLRECHAVIVCDEKISRVPFKNDTLIFQGKRNDQVYKSRLNIILCVKAQKYLSKGCDVFLARVTMKEAKDKLKGKRLEDVPIVRDSLEVFPEDLSGIPPTRQVEFQIDLVPSAASVAWAPYRLAPSEMKELAEQLQELCDKGFIRPSSSPWGAPGEKEEAAFQLIKQKLCSAPILALPKGSKNFIVYCDASHKGLGAVLMQNDKVIAYAS